MLTPACLLLIIGLLPLLWLPAIPSLPWIIGLLSGALFLLLSRARGLQYAGLLVLFSCWGLLSAAQSLEAFRSFSRQPLIAEGRVTRSDGRQQHEVRLLRVNGAWVFPPLGVRLSGSALPQPCRAGQLLHLTLRLRPIHGQLNEGNFDSQRFYLAQRLLFAGRILAVHPLSDSGSLQAGWMAAVRQQTARLAMQGVIMALAFGDRGMLTAEQKRLLSQTGTAHLLAISGMHISLAAGIGWLLGRLVQCLLPAYAIGFRLPLLVSLLLAFGYTWLSGAGPPAIRAMLALTIWSALRVTGRKWSSWEVWLLCVAGILFFDPLTLLSDSFCLSAIAVAALIFWYQWMPLPDRLKAWPWYWRYPCQLGYLQAGIMLLLLPLQVHIFHGVSISAWAANLFAVPMVTFAVVPLLLAGLAFTPLPAVAGWLWSGADSVLDALFYLLRQLPEGWLNVDKRLQWLSFSGWLLVIIWRFAAWFYALTVFLIGLIFTVLPLTRHNKIPDGWQMTMLDVGHGLAVAIIRQDKVLLYDTGSVWPAGDTARQAIIPWLKWHNLTLEAIVISHEHLDHIGGLASLQAIMPTVPVRSSLGRVGHLPCYRGVSWQWQGLQFKALWPPQEERRTGNNRSCVVSISDGHYKVLLTGDLEAAGEFALLRGERHSLAADFLQVPHHGSRTSSTVALLNAVGGRAAFASTSRYNAWRLPSSQIVSRYLNSGYQWYDTALSGQITLAMEHNRWWIETYRGQILPRWYHQWFGVAPDNR